MIRTVNNHGYDELSRLIWTVRKNSFERVSFCATF